MELFNHLMEDMKQPVTYIPLGVVVGMAVVLVLFIIGVIAGRRFSCRKLVHICLLCIYVVVMVMETFFSREPGSRGGIDLTLFSTWGDSWQAHAYVIENIIMFLPLGVLVPMAARRQVRLRSLFFLSVILSVSIEGIQLLTGRGYCQLDDVVMNVLGGCLGYGIYKFVNWLFRKK